VKKNLPPRKAGFFLPDTLKIYRLQTISYRLLIVSCKRPVAVLFLHRYQNKTIGKQYKGTEIQGLPTVTQRKSARLKTTIKPKF
jgi:hypothetical protein